MDLTPQENPVNPNGEPARPEPVPVPPEPTPPSVPAAIPAPKEPSAAAHVDLDKILLPKKETPGQTPISAERVNAGELLKQEQTAAAEGTKAQLSPEEKLAAASKTAAAHEAPTPVDTDAVQPLETYQKDIESVVQDKSVSVLSIATAEAERRAKIGDEGPEDPATKRSNFIRNVAFIGGGLLLLVVASGALAYLVSRTSPVAPAQDVSANTPFISVDGIKNITITADEKRDTVLANINAARQATALSLGLIEQLVVSESSTTANGTVADPLSADDFFNLMAPDAPAALNRSIEQYLLGVHVYDGNQPFIIAHVDSYEDAYAAMLGWENNIQRDLSPVFDYTPTKHIPEQNISTTTSTLSPATSSNFVDKILENEDTRALVNNYGDVYLLWTFLDRNTLVITTNDATLREIISRLKGAPVTPIPGQ